MNTAEAQQLPTSSWFRPGPGQDTRHERQGRLLHGYLHKTSNSLCGIKGYASLIATDLSPDPKTVRWARKILAEVEIMERIYRSIQEVAFPERKEPTGSDLSRVTLSAAEATQVRYTNLQLTLDIQTGCRLLLPARDLELVIRELLRNSAEGRDGVDLPHRVRVGIRSISGDNRRICLVVQDDGPGMSAELVPQVTNPFVTTKPEHLGIGLARVDTVMDMYGLAWSLESRPRRGTIVVLEVAEQPQPVLQARTR